MMSRTSVMLSALLLGAALTVTTGCETMTGKSAGTGVSDASITAKVQGKLTTDRVSNFSRIDVDTDRGVVNLSGVVRSAEEKARAAELARQVEGVKRVNNNLQIQSANSNTNSTK
jgi:hyperosmotically inducible protein